MKENFDDTQFITFDISGEAEEITNQIQKRFEDLGFEVLQEPSIRDVKKQYFNKYRQAVFIELVDELFIGDFFYWKSEFEEPTKRVLDFVEQLVWLKNQKEISNLKLILTAFAEEDKTSNEIIKVRQNEILQGFSAMSSYYYEIWTDNLIIEII